MNEELKLPICPQCHETKTVLEIKGLSTLLYVHDVYPWFKCSSCEIKWHAKEGVREKGDDRPCWL